MRHLMGASRGGQLERAEAQVEVVGVGSSEDSDPCAWWNLSEFGCDAEAAVEACRYAAEVKISDGGNSGLYFRTTRKPNFSDGYEAQIDSTHRDPIRTGSLYGFCHVYKQLVKPDTWFKYEIEVRDDVWRGRKMTRIKVTVDGDELYEYMDFAMTYPAGHFAFQHHDPGSIVHIRKAEVLPMKD
jgi:hypothetical protein